MYDPLVGERQLRVATSQPTIGRKKFEPYTNEYTNCRDNKRVAPTISSYKIYMKKEPEK